MSCPVCKDNKALTSRAVEDAAVSGTALLALYGIQPSDFFSSFPDVDTALRYRFYLNSILAHVEWAQRGGSPLDSEFLATCAREMREIEQQVFAQAGAEGITGANTEASS